MRCILLAGVSALIVAASAAMAEDAPEQECLDCDGSIITGYAAALARTEAVKREAETVIDSGFATDIGQFADRRLATNLARLPGTTIEPQTGFASVRGLPWLAGLSEGRERPRLANAFYDSNRATALDPGSALSQINVFKTSDARAIEGGIGGSIDLRTMRPFDFGWHAAVVQAAAGTGDPGGASWSASGLITDRGETAAGNVGGLLSLDWAKDRSLTDAENPLTAARFGTITERLGVHGAAEWLLGENLHVIWTGASLRSDPAERARGATWSLNSKTHLRDDSSGLEIQFEPTDMWSLTAAADFGETHAVRDKTQVDAGTAALTHDDDLAQLWAYRFDGIYGESMGTRFDFGFRGTSGTSRIGAASVHQQTYAGYAQIEFEKDWNIARLTGNAGVRAVETLTDSHTFHKRDAVLLPSLNLRAIFDDDLQLRLAVSQTMARPDTAALASGNALLKPMRSDNVDLGADYYFGPQSGVTFGAFHKDLHNIFLPDGASGVADGGSAGIDGLEFSLFLMPYDLPFPLDHLGTNINYTLIDGASLSRRLPGLARHSINVAETFEHGDIQARIAYRWQSGSASRALWPITDQTGSDGGTGALDADLYYTFLDRYRIGVEAENILGDTRMIDTAAAVHYARFETGRRILLSLHASVW